MRETLYTANVSGDNAVRELILIACVQAVGSGLKRKQVSNLPAGNDGSGADQDRLNQLRAGQFLEDGERRVLGGDHGFGGDEIGLLQRVLPAEHGVRHHVGVNHPA
jgi:hypothetical protein